MENLYKLLNLTEEASAEDIKKHCQQLLLQTHPDKNQDSADTSLFIKVQSAREILLDPLRRANYDKALKENHMQSSQKIIFDKVSDEELNFDEVTGEFFLECRCGGLYTVVESDIHEFAQKVIQFSMVPREIRWVFNTLSWNPTKHQLITALSALRLEEQERLQKFYFKKDYKLCLIGRLMIRQCIKIVLGIPWTEIVLSRSIKGKPFLANDTNGKNFFFNISHHGDFTVLAASTCSNVGVDIMKYCYPNNIDIPSFFKLMKRQFAEEEWSFIKSFNDEWNQLIAFYRLWCLKESYVKAIGIGIGTDSAASIKFKPKTIVLKSMCSDSELHIKNEKQPWIFYESMIDDQHVVSVAMESNCITGNNSEFESITFEQLVEGCDVVEQSTCIEQWWEAYNNKTHKVS